MEHISTDHSAICRFSNAIVKKDLSDKRDPHWIIQEYPEGVAYTPMPTEVKVQPLRGRWLRLSLFPSFSSAGTLCIPAEGEG